MKRLARLVILLVVAVGVALLAKNAIAKIAVVQGVKAITGVGLKIREMDVGLLNTRIGIKGLRVLNPPGFQDSTMMDVPEISVDYELASLLKGKAHLEEVRLDLKELAVVKNERGELNLQSLQAVKASQSAAQTPAKKTQPAAPPPPITVDALDLHIGKVVYKDYSSGTLQMKEFNVDIHERFQNITNPYALVGLIVTRALTKTSIARLTNFDLGALQSDVNALVRGSLDQTLQRVRKGLVPDEDALKGTTEKLKSFLGQ